MKLSIQAQAFLSLLSKLLIASAIIVVVAGLTILVPTGLLVGILSALVMIFCLYNLYQIELIKLKGQQDSDVDQK